MTKTKKTFAEWIKENNLTAKQIVRSIFETTGDLMSDQGVRLWIRDESVPKRMRKAVEKTFKIDLNKFDLRVKRDR